MVHNPRHLKAQDQTAGSRSSKARAPTDDQTKWAIQFNISLVIMPHFTSFANLMRVVEEGKV
eukprot:scaffold2357_cov167-Amphora_coffeaeformis.AAC.37